MSAFHIAQQPTRVIAAISQGVPKVLSYRLWIAWETGASAPDPGVDPLTKSRLNASAKRRITPFARNEVISHSTSAPKYAIIGATPEASTPLVKPTLIAGKYWSSS